jgi:CHASE1-domain containing sensor protein
MLKKENLPSSFLFIPWVILIFGLALTYALQDTPREANRQALHDEFEYRSNEIIDNINRRLQNYEQVLEGVAGLFTASHKVTQAEFSRYVETLKFEDKFPGIQGGVCPFY